MNNNFNNLVRSVLYLDEEEFNEIIENLPDVIKNNDNLDFSDYDYDSYEIEHFLINKYIASPFGAFVDVASLDDKKVWIWDVSDLEKLAKIKELLGDWTLVNEEEIIEDINEE